MNDTPPPPSHDDLGSRIARARADAAGEKQRSRGGARPSHSGLGMAFRVGVDLVAGLAIGVGIGVLLDHWLGTGPWLMVVFFVLGAAAGFLNVYRTVSGLGMQPRYRTQDAPDGREDDETPGPRNGDPRG